MLDIKLKPINPPVIFPQKWDYDQSVVKMRQLVVNWKKISVEILRELYIARQILSASGRRTDLNLTKNLVRLTWNQYLNDVGLNYETVRLWLKKYDFEKDELTTFNPSNLPKEIEGDDYLPTKHHCPNCGYEY